MTHSYFPTLSRFFFLISFTFVSANTSAAETRLLRQPSISDEHIAFVYAGDIWISSHTGSNVKRLTSTPAIERDPHFSPDGQTIAFSSNRTGNYAVYTLPIAGGQANRLTWHASNALPRGWTPDGERVLFASGRDTAPVSVNRLWTIAVAGGPASLLNKQWANDGAYSDNGKQLIIDRMDRWDVEWRNYKGGQNTPLVILDLENNKETQLPHKDSTDIEPVWANDTVYFISDRDWIANVWAYNVKRKKLSQVTFFKENDVKQLSTNGKLLAFEQNGYLHTLDLQTNETTQLSVSINSDFPWAETKWEDVSASARAPSISPTGKRAVFQARGEIFTVPVENGNTRNLSNSSGAADRKPIWSPNGDTIAWFSDQGGKGYQVIIQSQDGLGEVKTLSLGESKMVWEPVFSPDGKYIAFVDDDVRMKVLNIESGKLQTFDIGGTNLERGDNNLNWSPDSQWIAYTKTASNSFRQVWVWSLENNETKPLTNRFADSHSPAWDANGKNLYLLASTDIGLQSNWASTSTMGADSEYAAYVINLNADDVSPFAPKSDEEPAKEDEKDAKPGDEKDKDADAAEEEIDELKVTINFSNIQRRIMPLSMPPANYVFTLNGPSGSFFVAERSPKGRTVSIHKYNLEKAESSPFTSGVRSATVSSDLNHMLINSGDQWSVVGTGGDEADKGKPLNLDMKMELDRKQEWQQIFSEAWRYQRDYFYDPNMHGRDWNKVLTRYKPLVEFVKHRTDLRYLLDMVNGELSVGHSFVFGGDYPETADSSAGLLGADLVSDKNAWKIERIFTSESWNPGLNGPLDQPGLKVKQGDYIVGINGKEINADDNIYRYLDGTAGKQTILHINSKPNFADSHQVIVEPTRSESSLRQRTWVEDNRRLVDKLSNGKLAYIWVPNTANAGFTSFTRYFFAQQEKLGAVVDVRFNGGGLLDDYMVDLMSRDLRAGLTNEVPNGESIQLPGGIKGPKVLLVNELAGSGGDFLPWVFRQQGIGPLIGKRTWGGLVKSSVHYPLVDGGALTAPDNAVFDPIKNEWIAENIGVAPDIDVYQDAKSLNTGGDPQLERGVKELLKMLKKRKSVDMTPPKFPTPATNED
jgi:tricorn protease